MSTIINTYSTIHALIEYDGKYLVLQRAKNRSNPGYWNCVTGYIQERESAEKGAIREVKEETNLDGEVTKTAKPFWVDIGDTRWVVIASLIKVTDISNLKIDELESQDYKWINKKSEIINKSKALEDTMRALEIL